MPRGNHFDQPLDLHDCLGHVYHKVRDRLKRLIELAHRIVGRLQDTERPACQLPAHENVDLGPLESNHTAFVHDRISLVPECVGDLVGLDLAKVRAERIAVVVARVQEAPVNEVEVANRADRILAQGRGDVGAIVRAHDEQGAPKQASEDKPLFDERIEAQICGVVLEFARGLRGFVLIAIFLGVEG